VSVERGEPLPKQVGEHLVLHVLAVRLLIIPHEAERLRAFEQLALVDGAKSFVPIQT
jgi:hypothetical protein